MRKILPGLAVLVAAAVAYACVPRSADLAAFDPGEMARLETAMWRDYYEKRYPALFYHLYESSRAEFGFSPVESVRIALAAARAAKTFQPTRAREEANAALPDLVSYYGLLQTAAIARFDSAELARRELDWWQARREAKTPSEYGKTIADIAALTYDKKVDADILTFGIARAEAMAYRDARGEAITDQDWASIEAQLRGAYQHLKAAIGN